MNIFSKRNGEQSKLSRLRKEFLGAVFSFNTLVLLMGVVLCVLAYTQPVLANSIQSSKFFTGTKKMIEDLTSALMILVPIVGGLMLLICFLAKMAGDEMDAKKWNGRMKTILVCIVAGEGITILTQLIMGYFL